MTVYQAIKDITQNGSLAYAYGATVPGAVVTQYRYDLLGLVQAVPPSVIPVLPGVSYASQADAVAAAAAAVAAQHAVDNGTYVPTRINTLIPFGDSITLLDAKTDAAYSDGTHMRGYLAWANVISGQRFEVLRNAGIGGNRTADMVARIQADVMAYSPKFVILFGGANDTTNDVAAATTIANLGSMITTMRAAGIRVIVGTIIPSVNNNTTARKQALATVNQWIRALPNTVPDVVVVDWHGPLADAVTGDPASGMTSDGVHPTETGAALMGSLLARTLVSLLPTTAGLVQSNAEAYNFVRNSTQQGTGGTMSATGGSGSVATNSTVFGTGTCVLVASKVARTDIPGAFWQRLTIGPGSGGGDIHQTLDTLGWAAGDVLELLAEFRTSGTWADVANCAYAEILANPSATASFSLFRPSGDPACTFVPVSGILKARLAVPVGTTNVYAVVGCIASMGVLDIGRVSLRKIG